MSNDKEIYPARQRKKEFFLSWKTITRTDLEKSAIVGGGAGEGNSVRSGNGQ